MNDLIPLFILAAAAIWCGCYALEKRWQAEYYRRQCERLRDELADAHLCHNRDDNLQDREGEEWKN
jgi:hypothetical protein